MDRTRNNPPALTAAGCHPSRRLPRQRNAAERGSALVWALLFVVVTSGMVISHSIFLASQRKSADVRHSQEALAENFGRSGLVEAVGWFHRQAVQPVLTFNPQLDPLATPPLFDTIDPTLGLVREFEISQSLWGRYEVRNTEVFDISTQRGSNRPGTAWDLGVRAYVYRRADPEIAFDRSPNRVLATTTMTTEMRGVAVHVPMLAAINIEDVNDLAITGVDILIDGKDRPGVGYDDGLASPVMATDAAIDGTPARTGLTGLDLTPQNVFGMSLAEVQSYSDVVVPREKPRPGPLTGSGQIITMVKPPSEPQGLLLDDSVLVIDGNLILDNTSTSKVEGIVYVHGSLQSLGDLTINGALIVTGRIDLVGRTRVTFSDAVVQRVIRRLSQYRLPRVVAPLSEF